MLSAGKWLIVSSTAGYFVPALTLIRDQSRIKWIFNPTEIFLEANLRKLTEFIPLIRDITTVKECPKSLFSRKQCKLSDCERCRTFLGTDEDINVKCFYKYIVLRSNETLRLPIMQNIQKQYDNDTPPLAGVRTVRNSFPRRMYRGCKIEYFEKLMSQKNQNSGYRKNHKSYKRHRTW